MREFSSLFLDNQLENPCTKARQRNQGGGGGGGGGASQYHACSVLSGFVGEPGGKESVKERRDLTALHTLAGSVLEHIQRRASHEVMHIHGD